MLTLTSFDATKLDFIERIKDEIEGLEALLAAVEGYKPDWRPAKTVDVPSNLEFTVTNGQDKPKRKYTKRAKRWKKK